jgi:hypothetical protein
MQTKTFFSLVTAISLGALGSLHADVGVGMSELVGKYGPPQRSAEGGRQVVFSGPTGTILVTFSSDLSDRVVYHGVSSLAEGREILGRNFSQSGQFYPVDLAQLRTMEVLGSTPRAQREAMALQKFRWTVKGKTSGVWATADGDYVAVLDGGSLAVMRFRGAKLPLVR